MAREPWFQPKRSGLGSTPISWQGACVTLVMLLLVFATVGVIVALVHNLGLALLAILAITGAEPFTYRHARRTRE
jgi:Flp pilus assembly protein TadB